MSSKRERDQKEIQRLMEYFRKFSDEYLQGLINHRSSGSKSNSPNKKAFKAVLKERGID